MALRVRFQFQTASTLGYSIERLSDGLFWDFAAQGVGTGQTFVASPGIPIANLPEDSGNFAGRYKVTLATTPQAQFSDGDYCVTVHNSASANAVVGELISTMHGGDDAPFFSGGGSASDPWATVASGYTAGTFGAILTLNLDAKVSAVKAKTDNLPANPASVGSQMILAANGLDLIVIETGINARQALTPILAVSAGKISGAGTGTIVVKGAGTATTRLTVSGDSAGNRTAVTLNLPA